MEANARRTIRIHKKKGLNIIFAHLGYQNINDLWLEKEAGDKLVDRYKNDIKIVKSTMQSTHPAQRRVFYCFAIGIKIVLDIPVGARYRIIMTDIIPEGGQ